MAIKQLKIVADLETTTTPEDVRAWAVCAVDIQTAETVFIGNDLTSFFEWLENKNTVCYFHNLKFDGEFLLSWLFSHGYEHDEGEEGINRRLYTNAPKTFQTLITDTGLFYSITVIFAKKNKKYQKVTFYDSLKKLPFKVSVISKAFDLEDEKLVIDYEAPRPVGHVLTEEERQYIVNDCRIVSEALHIQIEKGLKKMTNASDAMGWFKESIGQKQFEYLFPRLPIELDTDIRRAYKGGFVYLKPEHKNARGLKGLTLDVNSLYPSVMYECKLPYGYPMYFEGEPEVKDGDPYDLFIVRLRARFRVKPNHLPTIQLKNNYRFMATEYITESCVRNARGKIIDDEPVELVLTSVDLALFLDHYDILDDDLEYISGYKFKSKVGIFKEYIDYWSEIKATSTGALRQLAKLMLNSLYGKFATNPRTRQKIPFMDEDGVVRYRFSDEELRDPVYTCMGAFITAYARNKTIRSGQAVYDRFIYADTDSLHLIGYDIPEGLEVHPSKLGAWKHEGNFSDSKFIRAKTYMETMHNTAKRDLRQYAVLLQDPHVESVEHVGDVIHYHETHVTCAGMPDNIKEQVTYDNFETGSTFDGKLMPKRFKGGVVLVPTTFTLK